VQGLLIVNPRATTTSPRVTDVLVGALGRELDLHVLETTHRGHGYQLGREACGAVDIVITLGGDGIIHEVVNGMLADGPGAQVPILAPVPGGSGNVFVRALGIPAHPVEATGHLVQALRAGHVRTVGLGQLVHLDAQGSVCGKPDWFTANAGLGIDAEVIAAMEQQRAIGAQATPARYLATTLRTWLRGVDRTRPRLRLVAGDGRTADHVFLAIVQNTAPWTYFGSVPINPCPDAAFERGLDIFALRSLSAAATSRAIAEMLAGLPIPALPLGRFRREPILRWPDIAALDVVAREPIALQVDGEFSGEVWGARFGAVANALRVAC